MESKRICVRGLPEHTSSQELKTIFSKFGNVTDVNIPKRNGVSNYGFVTLNSTQQEIEDCFRLFNNMVYKGAILKVEIAKQSFMERLQNERLKKKAEESTEKTEIHDKLNIVIEPVKKIPQQSKPTTEPIKITLPKTRNIHKINEIPVEKLLLKDNIQNDVIENIDHEVVNENIEKKSEKIPVKDKLKSDQLRLASQDFQRNAFLEKQKAISDSLKNLDSGNRQNKKIKFSDDSSEKEVNLFEDDNEEKNENEKDCFEIKSQFEGIGGHKLFQLQSTYNNDPRFKLDQRFTELNQSNQLETKGDEHVEDETKRNMDILQKVLGHKVTDIGSSSKKNHFRDLSMLRFDPMQNDADKFLISKPIEINANHVSLQETEASRDPIDSTRYYAVSDNLKQVFSAENDSSFSMLKTFSSNPVQPIEADNTSNNIIFKKDVFKNKVVTEQPFKQQNQPKNTQRVERKIIDSNPFFIQKSILSEGMAFFSSKFPQKDQDWDKKKKDLSIYLRNKKRRTIKRKIEIRVRK